MGRKIIVIFLMVISFIISCKDTIFSQDSILDKKQFEERFRGVKNGNANDIKILVEEGDLVLLYLVSKSQSHDEKERRAAIEVLGRIDEKDDGILNKEEIINVIVDALEDSNPKVLNKALGFLMDIDEKKVDKKIVDALIKQLDKGQGKAARILGRVGDPSLIPVLKQYLGKNVGMTINVRQALAKLGEKKYFDEIVTELESNNHNIRVNAIRNLGYIGNKEAIKKIAEFLFNEENPISESRDIKHIPCRYIAVETLSELISNPPMKKKVAGLYTEEDIKIWRKWWLENKHNYE